MFDRTIFIGLAVIVITAILLLVLRHPRVSTALVEKIPDRPQRRLFPCTRR